MVAENLEQVRKNIELACKEAGRDPKEVTLISVSKTKPVSMLQEAYEMCIRDSLRWMGEEPLPFAYMIERREIYANKGDEEHRKLISMEALGEEVE